jgi:HEPN domain-containing protein
MRPNRSKEIRRFFKVAMQRYEDAQLLLEGDRNTAANYLAGYAVECGLKALLLSAVTANECLEVVESFRGSEGHNLDVLKARYRRRSQSIFPKAISGDLAYVNLWSTSLRYEPSNASSREAKRFLTSTEAILGWIKGRL